MRANFRAWDGQRLVDTATVCIFGDGAVYERREVNGMVVLLPRSYEIQWATEKGGE